MSLLLSGAWRRKALEPHCVNHHPHFRVGGLLRFGGSAGCVSFPSLSFPSLSFPSLSPLCGACACWGLRGLAWPSLFCCTRGSAASPLSLSSPLSLPPPLVPLSLWCGGLSSLNSHARLPIRNIFVGSFEPDVPSGFASCFTYGPLSWVLLALCGPNAPPMAMIG